MDSRELIQAIMDEDFISAKSMTNDLVMFAVSDELDELRKEVASNLFGCDECEEENVNEARAKADYDRDGTVETSKDEVLGSRINAAVKSGKMTPAQAARTKSKGKYK
jgi:hypothetical protein